MAQPILIVAISIAMISVSGCIGTQDSIKGGCENESMPLLIKTSFGNMPSPNPAPRILYAVWQDGEIWKIEYTVDWSSEQWTESTITGSRALDLSLYEVCGVFSVFGYYPKPGEVKKPDSSYDSLKVDLKIKSVTTLNLAGADVQELTEAVEEKLFNLPANASKPNCADGGTIHFWGQVGGRTHSSKASCDWTDEFQEFRELFGGILGNAT
jgi:hypothetical protein